MGERPCVIGWREPVDPGLPSLFLRLHVRFCSLQVQDDRTVAGRSEGSLHRRRPQRCMPRAEGRSRVCKGSPGIEVVGCWTPVHAILLFGRCEMRASADMGQGPNTVSQAEIVTTIDSLAATMLSLLQDLIRIPSVSGKEEGVTTYSTAWAEAAGFETDLWQAEESGLVEFGPITETHLPLTGRPTLVIRLPGNGHGRSLIFNAHADVVPAPLPDRWRFGPWSGTCDGGRVYGRGACDAKGPLVSALGDDGSAEIVCLA